MVSRLILIIYFFVTGVFLITVPWSLLWPLGFAETPWLAVLLSNPALRGTVSGFGLVLIGGAILEIHDVISHKS